MRKIAVTLHEQLVIGLDRLVASGRYPNRSRAVQEAVETLIQRDKRCRLIRELANLDPEEERQLAEEHLFAVPWPDY